MSIWTDTKGRRHVGIMVRGKRVHRALPEGASAGDAKQVEAALREALKVDRAPVIPGDPTMQTILELYAEHAETLRDKAAPFHAARISPWVVGFRASQALHCAKHAVTQMKKPRKDLRPGHEGKTLPAYRPATINRSLGALTKGLTIAWEKGLTPTNYGLVVDRLPENNEREVFLNIEQVRQLADACSKPVATAIWTALLTGARRGEVCKIRAEDIGATTISIPKSHTKSFKSRVVPIVPALRQHLKHLPLAITYEGVKSGFRRGREKVGLGHVHFHDLRHSCASILIAAGVDLYTVSKILGHESVSTTQRYAHLQIGQQRAAMEKLSTMVQAQPKRRAAAPKRAAA